MIPVSYIAMIIMHQRTQVDKEERYTPGYNSFLLLELEAARRFASTRRDVRKPALRPAGESYKRTVILSNLSVSLAITTGVFRMKPHITPTCRAI